MRKNCATRFMILIFYLFVYASESYTIAPPKPGIQTPQYFSEMAEKLSLSYTEGGLVQKMQMRYLKRQSLNEVDRVNPTAIATDTVYLPVLLGEYVGTKAKYPSEAFQELLFDGPNPTGTMKDYYLEISYGQLFVEGNAYGWYKAPYNQTYYAGVRNGLAGGAAKFVRDIAQLADSDVDFGKYDNDGPDGIPNSGDDDGYVDTIVLIHVGEGAETGDSNNIWSHRWSLSGAGVGIFTTNDVSARGGYIKINDYIIQPELYNRSNNTMISIGVFCHEFGHALGLPDLYDTDDSSEGVGNWCLMGSGSYGGDGSHPYKPAHMSAWCKEVLGWVTPIVVKSNMFGIEFPQVENTATPKLYKVWKKGTITPLQSPYGAKLNLGREYFLVENRQKTGFDQYIYQGGMIIWHVDNSMSSNRDEFHKLVDMEEADGRNDMDRPNNRGDAGDSFPGITNNTNFDEFSQPNSLDYNNLPTQVAIWNISSPDSVMTANVEIVYERPKFTIDLLYVDDALGNNNGRAEAGEIVKFAIQLSNLWVDLSNLNIQVSTAEPGITLIDDQVVFGTVASKTSKSNNLTPISFGVDSAFASRRVTFDLNISGNTPFSPFAQIYPLTMMVGIPNIILVDDDGGNNFETYFQATLDSLDLPYDDSKWKTTGKVTAGYSYQIMIWLTGVDLQTVLTATEQDCLVTFLNNGGRLLLTGQNIAEDLNIQNSPFLSQVLHASWVNNSTDRILHGIAGDPVGDGLAKIVIAGGDGARNQTSPDIIAPDDSAVACFAYGTTANDKVAGIWTQNPQTNSKIVFLGFGFEAINSQLTGYATREQVLSSILTWLGTEISTGVNEPLITVVPSDYRLDQNYPNPFNPSTAFSFSLSEAGWVSLKVYNLMGQEMATVIDRKLPAGLHRLEFSAGNLPSGVYVYQLQANQFTQTRKMVLLR